MFGHRSLPDRSGSREDGDHRDVPDGAPRLVAEPAPDVGIAHRGQRMVAHARLRQELVGDEEMPLVDRTPRSGKGRADENRGPGAATRFQRLGQRVRDRADIALLGRIERRADLKEDLPAPLIQEPVQRPEREADRLVSRIVRDFNATTPASTPGSAGRRARRSTARPAGLPWPACSPHPTIR